MLKFRHFIGRLLLALPVIVIGIWQAKGVKGWRSHALNTWPALALGLMNRPWIAPIWPIFPPLTEVTTPQELRFFSVAAILRRLAGQRPVDKIITDSPQVLEQILGSDRGAIVVTPHYPIIATIQLFYEHIGSDLVVLGNVYTENPSKFARKHRLIIDFVRADESCFLVLRQKLSEKKCVVMNPDFKLSSRGQTEFVSDKIFRFAERLDVPLYFAKLRLMPDGTVVVSLQESTAKNAEAFIAHQRPERQFQQTDRRPIDQPRR